MPRFIVVFLFCGFFLFLNNIQIVLGVQDYFKDFSVESIVGELSIDDASWQYLLQEKDVSIQALEKKITILEGALASVESLMLKEDISADIMGYLETKNLIINDLKEKNEHMQRDMAAVLQEIGRLTYENNSRELDPNVVCVHDAEEALRKQQQCADQKESLIGRLNASMKSLEAKEFSLGKTETQWQSRFDRGNRQMAKELDRWRELVEDKDAKIQQLEDSLKDRIVQINTMTTAFNVLTGDYNEARAAVEKEKDLAARRIDQAKVPLQQYIRALEMTLKETSENVLKEMETGIAPFRQENEVLHRRIEGLEALLLKKDAYLVQIKEEQQSKKSLAHQIQKLTEARKLLKEKVAGAKVKMKYLRQENNQVLKQMKHVQKENKALIAVLQEVRGELLD